MNQLFLTKSNFSIFCFLIFSSCTPYQSNPLLKDSREAIKEETHQQVQILSWSPVTSTLILLSSKDVKLEEYALRQGQTKKLESLKNIFLQANEPTTIHVAKGFLNKKENELVLVKFLEVDRKKDF